MVFLRGELVGYITLLADCIILQTGEKKKTLKEARDYHQSVYNFPAVKIGRLGIQRELQRSGIGKQLLIYTIGVVYRMNVDLNIACRFITLDAYPQSVSWYEKHSFMFNKYYKDPVKPKKSVAAIRAFCKALFAGSKRKHPSMRYDLLKSPEIS